MMDSLAEQSREAGGEIHLLNGNHELMNVQLDMRYVSDGGYLDFIPGAKPDPETATAQDGVDEIAERILAIRPGGISSACGGLVWRVDVGMADRYGGGLAVLDLSGGGASIVRPKPVTIARTATRRSAHE
jgi:hypothetical protein